MATLDLDTVEGQYKAGLFCAKNYWNMKLTEKISRLETRALIYRLYKESTPEKLRKHNEDNGVVNLLVPKSAREEKKLFKAWSRGIKDGRKIREGE